MGLGLRLLALALCLTLGPLACAKRAVNSEPAPAANKVFVNNYKRGDIIDAKGEAVDPAGFAAALAQADYVLLGEGHASACDQAFEAYAVELMAALPKPPVLGLEMVPAASQPVLEKFNKGRLSLDKLAEALDWKSTWGYDFNIYAPIFAAAKKYSLPVYGLNAKKELVRKLSREGFSSFTDSERDMLPEALIPPKPEQMEFLREQFAAHGRMRKPESGQAEPKVDDKALQSFVSVQSLWDTMMARQAFKARRASGRPVLVLAGAGHVENGWGIAWRLSAFDPQAKVLLIAPWRGGSDPEPGEADFFFYCPAAFKSSLGMQMEQQNGKVVITAVTEGSLAEKAGIKPGDLVLKAGGEDVKTLGDLHQAAMRASQNKTPLNLTLDRQGQAEDVGLEVKRGE